MSVRAGGKVSGVRYAGSKTYSALELVMSAAVVASAIAATTFTVGTTANKAGNAYLIVTSSAASQPSDAAFLASAESMAVVANTPFSFNHTGETGGAVRKAWIQVIAGAEKVTSSVLVLMPHVGYSTVVLTSLASANRLIAEPDLQIGETVSWGAITGTGTVVVNNDGTFDAAAAVTSFGGYVGNVTDGWRALETQIFNDQASLFFGNNF